MYLALAPGANEHGSIPNGGSVSQNISVDGEIDSFTFQGNAGDMGLFSVSGTVESGAQFQIHNPDGTFLARNDQQQSLNLGQTGTYTVLVSSAAATGTGSYTLYLALAPGANEHGSIPNGGSVSQNISVDGEIDSFTFQGNAGDMGLFSVSGTVESGVTYEIRDPNGALVRRDEAQARINLFQTGTYTVLVRSFAATGTGDYALYLALAPGANEHGRIPNGGSVSQNISVDGEIDSFTFDGASGATGTISVTGQVAGGELYYVFDPNGLLIPSSNPTRTLNLFEEGTYTVIVQSAASAGTGPYVISLDLTGVPVDVPLPWWSAILLTLGLGAGATTLRRRRSEDRLHA